MSEKSSEMPYQVNMIAVPDFPEVEAGDDLVALLLDRLSASELVLQDGDVLVLAHKIIAKAEGQLVNLEDVTPSAKAIELAEQSEKDPRLVELILRESAEISRIRPGLIIVRHRLGFTSANAGIDRSNVAQTGEGQTVVLIPKDPDASAEELRTRLGQHLGVKVGIIIADTHGRPFRMGTVGVAIGVSGLPALWNRRGEKDRYGYELMHTVVATADEIAAAAGLLMGQAAEGRPMVLIRGLKLPALKGRARDLIRPKDNDLYR